ncbi:MAG: regulatory protein TetR [Solirubrobacterales bacterium]|jgi:AcrR family transcriptional regulator|nr:regulatory protein TetR [Solirubrobacterales bacterium]
MPVSSTTPKRAAVQADVLRATEQLLAEGTSWADLGVERIATTAGISRTAFYFYFADKRELLLRLTQEVSEQLYLEADRWYSGEGDDEAEIREALVKIAELYVEHQALLRVIVEVSTYDEEVATFWRGVIGRFVEATRMRIEDEQQAGKSPAFPPHATAFGLVWMCERMLYQLMVQETPFSRDEAIDALVRVFMRSVYS